MRIILTKTKNGPELFIKYGRYDTNPKLTQHLINLGFELDNLRNGITIRSMNDILATFIFVNTTSFENTHQHHNFIIKRGFFRRATAVNSFSFINHIFKQQNDLFNKQQIKQFNLLLKTDIAKTAQATKQKLDQIETTWNKIKDLNLDTENSLLSHLKDKIEKLDDIYKAEKEIYAKNLQISLQPENTNLIILQIHTKNSLERTEILQIQMENVLNIYPVIINLQNRMRQTTQLQSDYLHLTAHYLLDKARNTYKTVAHALSSLISNMSIQTNNLPNHIKNAIPHWDKTIQKEEHRLQQANELETQIRQLVRPIPEKKLITIKALIKRLGFKTILPNNETIASEQAPKDLPANGQEAHYAKRAWYKNLPFYLRRSKAPILATIPAPQCQSPQSPQACPQPTDPASASPKQLC